ncbi:chaplin family protein [Streptomyces bauhiniae]
MRQTLSKGMVVAAAATGVLSLYVSQALADSGAHGAAQGSPGALSGNTLRVPVHVPVSICGHSVDVSAALNPAVAEACVKDALPKAPRTTAPSSYGDDDEPTTPVRTPSAYGAEEPEPPASYGDDDETTPPPSYGHDEPSAPVTAAPASYGDDEETTPPSSYGDDEETTAPPSYGHDEETEPPASYGDDETTPPPYGGEETSPPPYGGEESTPPPGGHTTPPPGGHTTPPPGGHATPPPGEHTTPPTLPHTGNNSRMLWATSGAGALLIGAGVLLFRRGRTMSRHR